MIYWVLKPLSSKTTGWVFGYELSGCRFEFCCTCLEKDIVRHLDNCRVYFHFNKNMWHDKNRTHSNYLPVYQRIGLSNGFLCHSELPRSWMKLHFHILHGSKNNYFLSIISIIYSRPIPQSSNFDWSQMLVVKWQVRLYCKLETSLGLTEIKTLQNM